MGDPAGVEVAQLREEEKKEDTPWEVHKKGRIYLAESQYYRKKLGGGRGGGGLENNNIFKKSHEQRPFCFEN